MGERSILVADRGFTLVEVLATLVIIGIIFSIAVPNFRAVITRTQEQTDQTNIQLIQGAVEQYRLDTGKIPEDLQDLLTKPDNVTGWDGPYLERIPINPSGKSYGLDQATGTVVSR